MGNVLVIQHQTSFSIKYKGAMGMPSSKSHNSLSYSFYYQLLPAEPEAQPRAQVKEFLILGASVASGVAFSPHSQQIVGFSPGVALAVTGTFPQSVYPLVHTELSKAMPMVCGALSMGMGHCT